MDRRMDRNKHSYIFLQGLYYSMDSSSRAKLRFLNPCRITRDECVRFEMATLEYLRGVIQNPNYSSCNFFIAPFHQSIHWVLYILRPTTGQDHILDSLNNDKSKTEKAYALTKCVHDAIGNLSWNMIDRFLEDYGGADAKRVSIGRIWTLKHVAFILLDQEGMENYKLGLKEMTFGLYIWAFKNLPDSFTRPRELLHARVNPPGPFSSFCFGTAILKGIRA